MFNKKIKLSILFTLAVSASLWLGCDSTGIISVGGKVTGLDGTLVIQNNEADTLTITKDGAFTFDAPIFENRPYNVTVKTQPTDQVCTVSKGSGKSLKDISNIKITCSAAVVARSIGGTVSGLSGTVVLQNNADDDKSITSNGAYTFSTKVADGADYEVTVLTQPSGQLCTVTNGTGTATADVDNADVACINVKYAFTTAAGVDGNIGGIVGADAFCNADLNKPNGSTYKAFIVDGTARIACTTVNCTGGLAEHTDWVLAPSQTYVRANGTTIVGTTDANGLWVIPLTNPYEVDPVGSNQAARIWTGMNNDWTSAAEDCVNWTDNNNIMTGKHARRDEIDTQVINYNQQLCSDINALLCIEQ